MQPQSCAIVNQGAGSWAFEEHAQRLSAALWLDVTTEPADYVYLLGWDRPQPPSSEMFIPYDSILIASDKRRQADLFSRHGVRTPRTYLLDSWAEVMRLVETESRTQWILKYPTACGAAGHRTLDASSVAPENWLTPFVIQEFIRLNRPEVYRLYGVAGELFGWNARRFPAGVEESPWVAHARGARYEQAGTPPNEALHEAHKVLTATGLIDSFGCVDLLPDGHGGWLVLEVGTDGVFNHVDRDINVPGISEEIDRRLALAFWAQFDRKPWGDDEWKPKTIAKG